MNKFWIIVAICLLPPLGAVLAFRKFRDDEAEIREDEHLIRYREYAIDDLLENKNSEWSKKEISAYRKSVKYPDGVERIEIPRIKI